MFARVLSPVRAVRRRLARWSTSDDRRFHESLFAGQSHDPFSLSYPGFLTIRRFAELASGHFDGVRSVLDLGCGPGEITCELARRYPGIRFTGIDHSAAAVDRARAHASRLDLSNVTFATGDVASYRPPSRVDLIVMFDAFHHMLDPEGFVRHITGFTDRVFLIEPAGDALGRWRRTLDFDWLPCELDKIRARIEHAFDDRGRPAPAPAGVESGEQGRAVENRYPQEDYARFFAGFCLSIRGTVAGLDVYPPSPDHRSPWRERTMQAACDLLTAIDTELQRREIDHFAKHWAIYAIRGAENQSPPVQRRRPRGTLSFVPPVQGAFDASYDSPAIPRVLAAAAEVLVELTVHNLSWREWRSADTPQPVMLSYHWSDGRGRSLVYDGLRTPLRRPVAPGASCRAAVRVLTPADAGNYVLEIDLVEEGASWFSAAGVPPLKVPVRVVAGR